MTSAVEPLGVAEFDHHTPDFAARWRTILGELQATCPVARSTRHGGYAVVTRYDDATAVLRDNTAYSADRSPGGLDVLGGVTIPRNPVRMGMMEMDPPEHTAYRKLLAPWFSARAVAAWRPRLQHLVDWALDRVIASGRMDVVDDLAHVLPGVVTLDLLGLPLDRHVAYGRALGGAAYYEKGSVHELRAMLVDLTELVAAARAAGEEASPFLRRLLSAEVDGAPLPDAMIVELLFMLLNGGFDTSSALIAHMVLHLDGHPADRARLLADRTLVPTAVDELLRYYSPATGVARTALRDGQLGDDAVRSGERILVAIGAANNDPARFGDPTTFVLDRSPNPQISFGSGVHRCIGAFLATAEMQVLLERLLDRLPDLTVDRAGVIAYDTAPLVHGHRAVPVTFTPGARVLPTTPDGLPAPLSTAGAPPAGLDT